MSFVWYFLIHVSLGLIGYEVFTFTNLGAIYAAAAGVIFQGYAMYEILRVTRPRFDAAFVGTPGSEKHKEAVKQYWMRMGRLFVFRLCAFSILTLLVAAIMRNTGA